MKLKPLNIKQSWLTSGDIYILTPRKALESDDFVVKLGLTSDIHIRLKAQDYNNKSILHRLYHTTNMGITEKICLGALTVLGNFENAREYGSEYFICPPERFNTFVHIVDTTVFLCGGIMADSPLLSKNDSLVINIDERKYRKVKAAPQYHAADLTPEFVELLKRIVQDIFIIHDYHPPVIAL